MKKRSHVFAATLGIWMFFGYQAKPDQLFAQANAKRADSETTFNEEIKPLLRKFCADCHEPGSMKEVDFLAAHSLADLRNQRGVYAGVVEQLESNAMPPGDSEQPNAQQKRRLISWIKETLELKLSDTDRIAQYVVEIFQDSDGNLWFGTVNRGVARFDGKSLRYFTKKDGLPNATVPSIAEDQAGNIWFGTHRGVARFDGDSFESIDLEASGSRLEAGPLASVSVHADRKGNIWASLGRKVFRFSGTAFVEFKLPIDLAKSSTFAIAAGRASLSLEDSQGNLWFATDGFGAFKYDGKSFAQFTKRDGLCSNNVNRIVEDDDGNIWFACMQSYQPAMTGDGGVCRYDGTTFTKFPDVKGLSKNDIYTIYKTANGDIWIGATGVGAYRFDGTEFKLYSKTNRPHWTRHFGLQSMLEDRNGTLWFGFSGGLFRFDGRTFFNVTKKGPWEDLTSVLADLVDGSRDSAEWIRPAVVKALASVASGDLQAAAREIVSFKKLNPDARTVQEPQLNRVGNHLLFSRKKLDLAVRVFEINTLLYPNSFSAFESLGYAYHQKRDLERALRNYKKSVELNPGNKMGAYAIKTIEAQQRYQSVLVAPEDWAEEVILLPPSFAPKMSVRGFEHLRFPPQFRNPDSDWFMTYLFAIELTDELDFNQEAIGQQLLLYFQGLSKAGRKQDGSPIDTSRFKIAPIALGELDRNEFAYVLDWREPFAAGTKLRQTIRVKLIHGKNQQGVLFVCCSPEPQNAQVWGKLLKVRSEFERVDVLQGARK